MTITRKGLRKISVEGIDYNWKIGKTKEWCPCCINDITIMIEKLNGKKPLLIKLGIEFEEKISIKPSNIKEIILYALKNNWNPDYDLEPFHINYIDLKLLKP